MYSQMVSFVVVVIENVLNGLLIVSRIFRERNIRRSVGATSSSNAGCIPPILLVVGILVEIED